MMKIFVWTKKKMVYSSLLVLLLVALLSINYDYAASILTTASAKKDLPIYCVGRDDNKVAISFDAAWGNEDTEQLIEILEKYNVKTTFFVVGQWVDKYPESVKQLADAGHEVMNHSNTHPHMTKLSAEQMKTEVLDCGQKIENVTGQKPFLLRPPYGDYNDSVVSTMRDVGYYTIQWDVDSLDWKDLSADQIVSRIDKQIQSGSIVLFHNAAKHTPEALPRVIETIQSKGLTIVPVSELIYRENFTINHEGRQILTDIPSNSLD